jgi:hypothetical protein
MFMAAIATSMQQLCFHDVEQSPLIWNIWKRNGLLATPTFDDEAIGDA